MKLKKFFKLHFLYRLAEIKSKENYLEKGTYITPTLDNISEPDKEWIRKEWDKLEIKETKTDFEKFKDIESVVIPIMYCSTLAIIFFLAAILYITGNILRN